MHLLLRVLMLLQRLHSAQATNRLGALVNRSTAQRKRKAAVVEADCLECIKILLDKTNSWSVILDVPGNLELICTNVLQQPSGFLVLLRSLTTTAASNRDENRLTPIVAQLKHGLHTGKLHIQILTVRFLNAFRRHAPSANYSLLVQLEAENAGFSPDRIQRVIYDQGIRHGVDDLNRELSIWRQSYHLPAVGSTVPTTFARTPTHTRTQSAYVDESPLYAEYHNQRNRFDSFDTSDTDDTLRGRRVYDSGTTRSGRHSHSTPVERQRARRLIDFDDRSLSQQGMVHPDRVQQSQSSRDLRRSMESLSQKSRGRSTTTQTARYNRSDSMPAPVSRARSEGSMQRLAGAGAQEYDTRTPASRHAQFRSASVTPAESRARDQRDFRGTPVGNRISRSVHDLARISEEGSRPSSRQGRRSLEPLRPVNGVTPVPQNRSVTPVLTRLIPPPDEVAIPGGGTLKSEPDGSTVRTLPPQNGVEMELISPKPRVQGFSYLFPQKPVTDIIPKREQLQQPPSESPRSLLRARTPEMISTTPSLQSPASRPQSAPILDKQAQYSELSSPSTTVTSGGGNVVYIPVRVQGGGLRRRPASTQPYQTSLSTHSENEDPVREALSNFDYLNEYETSSRSSRF